MDTKGAEMAFAAETTAQMKTETAQKRGRTLLNLKCVDATSGLLGKTLLVLEPSKGGIFPPHKFGSHDVVALKANRAEASTAALGEGVVYRVKDNAITVAMDDVPEEGLDAPLRMEKLANEVTYRRLKDTLTELHKGVRKGPATELVPVLFGDKYPTFAKKPITFTPFNQLLDQSQQAAVAKALAAKDVMLLHGPPGTGKTTAVVEVITQEVKRGSKVLACAASNIAVDNLVERLVQNRVKVVRMGHPARLTVCLFVCLFVFRVKVVRMGHPARLLPQVLESALDAQVLKADNTSIATDVRKEIKQLSSKLLKTKDRREKGELTRDLKRLAKEEKKRQTQAVVDVIKDADVIASTLTGALTQRLKDTSFDLVVIDEAAQALECACWIALLKGRRCVLAGDHLQLPPTVQSAEAEAKGLGITLFERLDAMYAAQATSMLTMQYRMNSEIMRWSSDELYGGKIGAHPTVAKHRLCDMDGVTACNATEAVLVGLLKEMRANRKQIAAVEISTVDGFQGREKEAIVISMVRSNPEGEVGFLSDERRMNVAVTRARRHCAVVCDSDTVGKNAFLKRMVSYFEQHGEYLSAMEYLSA
ncbi:hypothetical protein CBR_g55000 [Chara braunii]|uniref:DNA helicase n=1 Tax=Chara braunii TaxID=69332 RepID=A0A388K7J0_CHABU|nr:hypothetical protein CBR_g55000 [Chara braunii]|eukprot:GBG66020.1 hypothetical protein CBR_g55000 [Chara braunii]